MTYTLLIIQQQSEQALRLSALLQSIAGTLNVQFDIHTIDRDFHIIEQNPILENSYLVIADYELCARDNYRLMMGIRDKIVFLTAPERIDNPVRFEETFLLGASTCLSRPYTEDALHEKILPLLDILKYSDSYSNIMIRSLMRFHSSEDIASKMVSTAKIACIRFQINPQEEADLFRILEILSIAIKTDSLIKTIKLFEDLKIARRITELLKDSLNPKTLVSALIHLIYHFERFKFQNRPVESFQTESVKPEILNEIKNIFLNKEIFIQNGTHLESVWVELIDTLNQLESIPMPEIDSFIADVIKFTKHIIVYHGGGVVTIRKKEDGIAYTITPQDYDYLCDWFEKFQQSLTHSHYFYCQDGCCELRLNYPKEHETFEDNTSADFIDFSESEEIEGISRVQLRYIDGDTRQKITAIDYIKTLENRDILDSYLETLRDLESLMDETLHNSDHLTPVVLVRAGELFSKYGAFLSTLQAFSHLSYVMLTLSSVMHSAQIENLAKRESIIFQMLSSILEDLKNWKLVIFITRESKDIHYLDDSLLSSCAQLEAILNGSGRESETENLENDLELF